MFFQANDYYTFTDGTRCNGSLVVDLWNMADGVDPAGAPYGRPACLTTLSPPPPHLAENLLEDTDGLLHPPF